MRKTAALAASLLAACAADTRDSSTRALEPSPAAPLVSGIDTAGFDRGVRPQDNFFDYTNGVWIETTTIPADKSNYGAFTRLADAAEAHLRAIIEEAAAEPAPAAGSAEQKIGDFYRSFMDVERVDALGVAPLADELARIEAIDDREALAAYLGSMLRLAVAGPLAFYINQDSKRTSEYIVWFTQAGLGLPDRDFYFREGAAAAALRDDYAAYLAGLYELAGLEAGEEAARAADAVMGLETRIAEAHWTRVRNRDRDATYNKLTRDELVAAMEGFELAAYLSAAGIEGQSAFVVRQPDYVEALDDIVAETPLEVWKDYLRARLLSSAAPYLSRDFVNARFDFYGRKLSGIEAIEPRWKRAVQSADAAMGELIGQIYVERHFGPEARARMDELVANLKKAFRLSIDRLEWMTDETKAEARDKLARFTTKIGYPDTWKDYSALEIRAGDLLGNMARAAEWDYRYDLAKLDGPVDRGEWFMTPQTVNAYYNPSMNEIVFPAAILQPPFFNVAADDAVNYGAIGAVIGHEISHGFDDQGRKSDGHGRLRNWWTEVDEREFGRRAQGLVEQYDEFSPLPGEHVNGELTLGENIADLAGLTVAYRAYRLSLGGAEPPVIDGMTGAQRFFTGWSQVWRRKYRKSELKRRLVTDVHSPSEYRVIGVLRNMPEFHRAFGVESGDGMYLPPDERVAIW